ncbi:hypothetical protein SISNIDRAFT_456586 [Sistotremastrum niveocremeum HHB9708]|uniref:Uncharacterized protein n=1 Tax=Sistotremastrum niveocremeum HHB9708 TaxID=1314777 RepID=A0A164SNR8_9AGAM|nr:hypothetical protein SISNIDRAFT_456586 [Sistotremastrum niveocremeum HHB9708]
MSQLLKDLQRQYAVASAESSRYGWGLLGSDVRQRNKSLQLKRRKEILLSSIEREKERIAKEDLLMIAVSDVDLDGYESDRSAFSSYSSSSSSASSSSSTYPSSRDSSPEPYIPTFIVRSAARSPRSPQSQRRSPTASSLRSRRARASEGSSLVARSFTLSGISAAGNLDEGLIEAFNSLGLEEQRSVLDEVPGLADALDRMKISGAVREEGEHDTKRRGGKVRRSARLRSTSPY